MYDRFQDYLDHWAAARPDGEAYRQPGARGADDQAVTYGELRRRARLLASALLAHGLRGERVLLSYPSSIDFMVGFFACLYAEAVAVPVNLSRNSPHHRRMARVASDCGARAVLSKAGELNDLRASLADHLDTGELAWLSEADATVGPAADVLASPRAGDGATLALLQYTSGSTGAPKGVMITHRNIIANQGLIRNALGTAPGQTFGGWLPQFHDMGLIGLMLHPIYVGARTVFVPPLEFVQKPARWLRLMSDHGAYSSAAPNFAFDHCVKRVSDADMAGVDLSRWQVALVGSEPVNPLTMRRFAERFAPWGFDPRALLPAYGLAEATLFVSGGPPRSGLTAPAFDTEALARGEARASSDGHAITACGEIQPGLSVAIVSTETGQRVGDATLGEIWISGASVSPGYWGMESVNRGLFGQRIEDVAGHVQTGFVRTGDLGFIRAGQLFASSRLKDLIIIRGRNYAPQDVEQVACAAHPGVRSNGAAAFSVPGEDSERLVVVQELAERNVTAADITAIMGAIAAALSLEFGLAVTDLVLVAATSIQRTTSGKIMRHAVKDDYLAGRLAPRRIVPIDRAA